MTVYNFISKNSYAILIVLSSTDELLRRFCIYLFDDIEANMSVFQAAAEAIQLLKGISLLISQQRNSALNHTGVSQILYKYVLRLSKNQQIRLSIAEIINTAKTP